MIEGDDVPTPLDAKGFWILDPGEVGGHTSARVISSQCCRSFPERSLGVEAANFLQSFGHSPSENTSSCYLFSIFPDDHSVLDLHNRLLPAFDVTFDKHFLSSSNIISCVVDSPDLVS